jgi:uncharacterized protein YcgI (DUF1989 family)
MSAQQSEPAATTVVVPAGHGRAVRVEAGRCLRLSTPRGRQVADFFAFNADDPSEWLSPGHTWASTRLIHPAQGQELLSTHRRPLLRFVEDGAKGVHDMTMPACDAARYVQFGVTAPHRNCADNLRQAMAELGLPVSVIPQPINFFMTTTVVNGALVSPPSEVPPGAYVVLEALVDLICAVSSCPFDVPLGDWSINAPGGPSELLIEVA